MSSGRSSSDFSTLSAKQQDVINLLADGRTSKEIADVLGMSESAVNQRVDVVRNRFGGIPRAELARRYRAFRETPRDLACETLSWEKKHLPAGGSNPNEVARDDSEPTSTDGLILHSEAEPRVVPEALDGPHAFLVRTVVFVGMALGIAIAGLVLLSVSQALSELI